MFEQASIDHSGLLKRPWAMTVSFAGQAAALSAFVLVSLIRTDSLTPRSAFFTGVVAPPGSPTHIRSRVKVTQTTKSPLHILTAPMSIPTAISSAGPESPMLSPDEAAGGAGAIGGIDGISGQSSSGLVGDLMRLPAPPAEPVRRPQEKVIPNPPARQIHVSTGVQAAKLITQVNPVYPALARQARVAGTVRLTAIIGRDGAIRNLQVMSGHPLLTSVALEAVKQWRYQPTLLNDEPVEVITQIDVNFTLSR
jgi:protein TonB